MRENREIPSLAHLVDHGLGRSGNTMAVRLRCTRVGSRTLRSTCEPAEQGHGCGRGCGGGGGKGAAKGNTASKTHPGLSAGPVRPMRWVVCGRWQQRDKGARFTALLHHVDAVSASAGLLGDQPEGRAGGGRGDVGRAMGGTWRRISRICMLGCSRGVTGPSRVRRAYIPKADGRHAAVGDRVAGGQDRSAGRRRGAQRRLRGGLPGLLVWVPAGARPHDALDALAVGIRAEAGELGARCGHPQLFRPT